MSTFIQKILKHTRKRPKRLLKTDSTTAGGSSAPAALYQPTPVSDLSSALPGPPETSDSKSRKYPRLVLPRPLFALLIGIDKYKYYPHLVGAVEDVKNVEEFLVDSLAVPTTRIKKLLDLDATSVAIVREIRFLIGDTNIKRDDAILIYFAGHGARAIAPKEWETPDGHIETICPVDMSANAKEEPLITGIPDLVLNALIAHLAEQKGDNITVIFDCCHSANGLRGERVVPGIRGIDDPPPVFTNWGNISPLRSSGVGRSASDPQSLECSVLLAACGRLERAREDTAGGLFTQKLLDHIIQLSTDQLMGLTYKDLIRPLSISDSQHPQCEGSKPNRYLFQSAIADQSFIYGCKGESGNLLLDAGKPLGITLGAEFEIYSKNGLSPDNPSCGRLKVKDVSWSTSTLSFDEEAPHFEVPDPFYAIQTSFSMDQRIKVFCSDIIKLNQVLLKHQRGFSGFATLVDAPGEAVLLVSFGDCDCMVMRGKKCKNCQVGKNKSIYFDWADENIISGEFSRIGEPISIDNPKEIVQVFRAAARFHYYLYSGEDASSIRIAHHQLRTRELIVDGESLTSLAPDGSNILEDELPPIQLDEYFEVGPYGLTIYNYTSKHLFLQVFWFEGRNLKIEPLYTGQHGSGLTGAKADIEAPLRAAEIVNGQARPGEFGIGYGENNVQPWTFKYCDTGNAKLVGFFKIFLATFEADYTSLSQLPPFDYPDTRDGVRWKSSAIKWWATKRAKVVQLPPI